MRRYKFWHTYFIYFIFSSLALISKVEAKPRGINLEEELPFATMVLPVKILSYDSGSLKFQPIGKARVMSVRYSSDPKWNPRVFIEESWPPKDEKAQLTSYWPPVNSEVLIVTDKGNIVSLFAWDTGQEYRFWSPLFTGSIAIFECKPLGRSISLLDLKGRPSTGWDGCLVEKSRIITTDQRFPIHEAIVNSDLRTVERFLEQGIGLEDKDSYGRTLLQLAFDFDKLKIAEFLIGRGADIEVRDVIGQTLLHRVIRSVHLGRVDYSKDHEAKMLEAIELLIELKPSLINLKDNAEKTPWEVILERMKQGDEDYVLKFLKPFVSHGADLETRNWGDWQNFTPFQRMILDGRLKSAKLLLEHGANVNAGDEEGRSLLYIFVEQYHSRHKPKTEIIERLLEEYGLDPNIPDNQGRTSLHKAVEKADPKLARMLLKYGADPLLKDEEGVSPVEWARLLGRDNAFIQELLASEIKN